MTESAESKSPLVEALEKRPRQLHDFDAGSVLDGAPGAMKVRLPTVSEELSARIHAATYVAKNAGEAQAAESVRTDWETLQVLNAAFRDPNDADIPAFGSPQFMAQTMKPEEVESLLSMLIEVRARESKRPREVDADFAMGVVEGVFECLPEEAGEALVHLTRDDLVQTIVQMSRMIMGLLTQPIGEADDAC